MTGERVAMLPRFGAGTMNRRLMIPAVLLYVVAGIQMIGGLYDFLTPMPSFHETFLGATSEQLDSRVVRLDLAQMDAIGGLLFASGLTVIVLVSGPFRRGDRSASVAILLLVVVGQAGNSFGMYQVGSPYWVPLVEIGLTLLALEIASLSRRWS